MTKNIQVLFVCLGNICRSPMAEAVFRNEVEKAGLEARFDTIDSCGTGAWHVGNRPDPRTLEVLKKNGIHTKHLARKLSTSDFKNFDYIFAMDSSNLRNINRVKPQGSRAKVMLFGEYASPGVSKIVDDPYYGGSDGFGDCYIQLVDFSQNFLKSIA
ncbi:protein tyrosine phosphatase Stp1, unknown biological role [Schizosaccharomyces pombe]|uniref:Low molecular weight phosphotyrosine protein phosphatase n=1 Tax=Schizosaccharomyces pombe (strain 972 / ATCC 24843) TaxID=284812 RepID=PPAL_SCHPO|nr:dual-specificity phosphatase Stp1 [Schizosaccharomyces pombe]P41893.1 RecName: Full=Low molecular weight phosphotyrosine protein phosphatase; AltName: Full=Low molecular weight cytosolic acid phosphatase; AltName: Full=PTPase; AltName: Full=Small tyrosine phosphatase [Schizosaccharomyces pombe 972h-]AAA61930.1 low Mr protein tyrosine phosphatase [Schizosaccharomyces pombe]CAB59888.2 dual specificity phosphatase Stp1 [Schizosaccharomyces pombe]|eukprot:NP_001342920.1 dual-specificity phosphatase Stp1 [Schizosaccharomyces pombe]